MIGTTGSSFFFPSDSDDIRAGASAFCALDLDTVSQQLACPLHTVPAGLLRGRLKHYRARSKMSCVRLLRPKPELVVALHTAGPLCVLLARPAYSPAMLGTVEPSVVGRLNEGGLVNQVTRQWALSRIPCRRQNSMLACLYFLYPGSAPACQSPPPPDLD